MIDAGDIHAIVLHDNVRRALSWRSGGWFFGGGG